MGRLLYDVMQTGISYEMTCKQQECINLISSPAAIFYHVPVVIWWQCVGSSAAVPGKRFWTDKEAQALEQAGCDLLSPTELLLENARTWRRPVLCATESLILVQPEQVFGEVQESHPIWNEIAMKVAPTEAEQLTVTANTASLLRRQALRHRYSSKDKKIFSPSQTFMGYPFAPLEAKIYRITHWIGGALGLSAQMDLTIQGQVS